MRRWLSFWAFIGYSYVLLIIFVAVTEGSTEEAGYLGSSWTFLVIGVVVIKYTIWAVLKKIFRTLKK